jgi:hypothetical protein
VPPDASYRFLKIQSFDTPFLNISSLNSPSKSSIKKIPPKYLTTCGNNLSSIQIETRDRKCLQENNTTFDFVEDIVSSKYYTHYVVEKIAAVEEPSLNSNELPQMNCKIKLSKKFQHHNLLSIDETEKKKIFYPKYAGLLMYDCLFS